MPKRKYIRRGGIIFDTKLLDVGAPLMKLLHACHIRYVSVQTDHTIAGRSWEMACAMSLNGATGIYTGEVIAVHKGHVTFGAVDMVDHKRQLTTERIYTYKDYKNGVWIFSATYP